MNASNYKSDFTPHYVHPVLLADYLSHYIYDLRSGTRLKKGCATRVANSYIKSIEVLRNRILVFEKTHQTFVSLDDVDMKFQREYLRWSIANGYLPNTLNTEFSRLRTVMKCAYEDHLTEHESFRNTDFVPRAEEVDQIYLDPGQIHELMTLDLSSLSATQLLISQAKIPRAEKKELRQQINDKLLKRLEYTRDHFVIACLTGQRISDFMRISRDMYTQLGDHTFISLVQRKTDKKVLIPVDTRVNAILQRHHGQVPHVPVCQFNGYLRIIGILLHWTHKTRTCHQHRGAKSVNRFCDLLTSHTGRRSFATNAYAAGVPLASIMAITGHSSETTLRNYLKLRAIDKALIAARDFQGIIQMKN